jgi:hypothetical protein
LSSFKIHDSDHEVGTKPIKKIMLRDEIENKIQKRMGRKFNIKIIKKNNSS